MNILQLAAECIAQDKPSALVTIIRTAGSTPRHAGAKMLVGGDGTILAGTIGGGEMESRVIALAQTSITDGQPRTVSYQLADPKAGDPGVCGGTVELFIEPLLTTPTLVIAGAGHVGRALAHQRNFWADRGIDHPEWGFDPDNLVVLSDAPASALIGSSCASSTCGAGRASLPPPIAPRAPRDTPRPRTARTSGRRAARRVWIALGLRT